MKNIASFILCLLGIVQAHEYQIKKFDPENPNDGLSSSDCLIIFFDDKSKKA